MRVSRLVLLVTVAFSGVAGANDNALVQSALSHATIVSSGEMTSALNGNTGAALSDSVLRVIAIAPKFNVGVAVVRRSRVNGRTPPDALVHEAVTEVYQIVEGKGVLVTGGALQSAKPITDPATLGEIGPSSAGQAIVGGIRHRVGPGDIVVIPAGAPHGFVEVTTARIVYTLIRIDPKQVLRMSGKPYR